MRRGCLCKNSAQSPAHLPKTNCGYSADDASDEKVIEISASDCKLQSSSQPALCLQGGGFRSVVCDAGITAGLLAFLAKYEGLQPTIDSSGLYDRFSSLSTCSGGSWFAASLIYSSKFATLVELMGASPETAGQQFKDGWVAPWLSIGAGSNFFVREFENLAEEFGLNPAEVAVQTLVELGYFWRTGLTWNNFVETLLSTTAGIDANLPTGAAVPTWAEGKVWDVNHSVLTGNGGAVNILASIGDLGSISYSANANNHSNNVDRKMPSVVPAKFSVTLGAGVQSSAPSKYSAVELPGFRYKGMKSHFPFCCSAPTVKTSCSEAPNSNYLEQYAGMLPVSGVAAASSAFLGDVARSSSVLKEVPSLLHAQLTPWVSQAPNGRAFSHASDLVDGLFKKGHVTQEALDALACNTVRGVADAGFTDGTGISQAVAEGSQEVVAFLNLSSTEGDFDKPIYLEKLFAGGIRFTNDGRKQDQLLFPIFAESAATVQKQYAHFMELDVPSSAKYLAGIKVGTLTATTLENQWFGIKAGREVKIHIVSIGSSMKIGLGDDFFHYDRLLQEIVDCLVSPKNVEVVRGELLPMMLGESNCR